MLLIIAGKTCSGKDYIVSKLCKSGLFSKVVTYTSRPKRKGEKEGVNYHYKSKEEFEKLIEDDFFAEHKLYHSAKGDWYYGTAREDITKTTEQDRVIILTPEGIKDLEDTLNDDTLIIYLYANDSTIWRRLEQRGDDKWERARRVKADREDFQGFENYAHRIVYSNDGNDPVEKIVDLCKEFKEKKER